MRYAILAIFLGACNQAPLPALPDLAEQAKVDLTPNPDLTPVRCGHAGEPCCDGACATGCCSSGLCTGVDCLPDAGEKADLDEECGVIGRQCCTDPVCKTGVCTRDEDAGMAFCR